MWNRNITAPLPSRLPVDKTKWGKWGNAPTLSPHFSLDHKKEDPKLRYKCSSPCHLTCLYNTNDNLKHIIWQPHLPPHLPEDDRNSRGPKTGVKLSLFLLPFLCTIQMRTWNLSTATAPLLPHLPVHQRNENLWLPARGSILHTFHYECSEGAFWTCLKRVLLFKQQADRYESLSSAKKYVSKIWTLESQGGGGNCPLPPSPR